MGISIEEYYLDIADEEVLKHSVYCIMWEWANINSNHTIKKLSKRKMYQAKRYKQVRIRNKKDNLIIVNVWKPILNGLQIIDDNLNKINVYWWDIDLEIT